MASLLQIQDIHRTVGWLRLRGYRYTDSPYPPHEGLPLLETAPYYMRSLFGKIVSIRYGLVEDCKTRRSFNPRYLRFLWWSPVLPWRKR